MTTPRGAPELVESQAVPETTVNEQIRRTEGGAGHYPVADRVIAPPGTCADGAQYIIIATATGAFAGKEGQIAQAVGTNAASGWHYRVLGAIDEGVTAYVQDEDAEYKWDGSAWGSYGGSGYAPGGTDVALADGGTGASLSDPGADRIMFWDDSAGAVTWLEAGSGLSITDTTISATGGSLTLASTVTQSGTPVATSVGFLGSPQISDQDDYTLALTDAGGHYYHVSGTPHTLTIPANASVAFPIGTVIAIVNEDGGGDITLAITSDTLRWTDQTGSRTIAENGTATLLKVAATVWRLTGDGIT